MSALPPALAAWAATAELSGLTDTTAETARQYLSRYYDFTPATREEFGRRIAAAVAAQVTPPPPPGTSPPDYLSAVLAERRDRAHARIATQTGPGSPAGTAPAGTAPAGTAPAGPRPPEPRPTAPADRPQRTRQRHSGHIGHRRPASPRPRARASSPGRLPPPSLTHGRVPEPAFPG